MTTRATQARIPLSPLLALLAALALMLLPAASAPSPRSNAAFQFVSDKGKFRVLINGQQAGEEDFEIRPGGNGWIAHGESEIHAGQSTTRVSGTLELHADGAPARYEWSTEGEKKASATITFDGPTASIELRLGAAHPYTQQLKFDSQQIVVLDNNLYDQYTVLARLYDWKKKGEQSFNVLVPQELTPGKITVDSLGPKEIDGKWLEELRGKTEDLEVDLYFDGPHLERIEVPDSNAEIIRE